MTPESPVERVVDLLVREGMTRLDMPLRVATIDFGFSAALEGPERGLDLVLIIDTVAELDIHLVQRRLEGLSRALDVIGSRRSLSVVLVGPTPPAAVTEAISRIARVLFVGSPVGPHAEDDLRTALAVLLPLIVPRPSAEAADPIAQVAQRLGEPIDPGIADVLDGARLDSARVSSAFTAYVSDPLLPILREEP